MDRRQVVDAVRNIMQGARFHEAQRLEVISDALKPWSKYEAIRQLQVTGRSEEPSFGMRWRSQTNFLPLVVDVYSQSMKVDNYLASDTKETAKVPWEWWQRNKMDARQTGINRSVLAYGVAYATLLPSLAPQGAPSGRGAFIRPLSPRQMTCLYGEPMEWVPGETPVDDDWPILALEMKDQAIRLYDEEFVYFLGVKSVPHSALGWRDPTYLNVNNFEYLEERPHGFGVCPVVKFRDRWLLDGEEQYGIVEPLLNIQDRIDETTYQMQVSQYFTAFTQRWVAGWRPRDQTEALAMVAGDTWFFDKADTKVGQFEPGEMTSYIEAKQSAVRDLAAIGQVPAQNLGVDALANISEATLAGLETGKKRKTAEIQTTLGESYEQMLRGCAHLVGDTKSAEDFGSEVKWSDLTARTLAETVDALIKLQAGLGLPDELLWEDVPGKTKNWVERAKQLREEQQARMQEELPQTAQPVPDVLEPRPEQ